MCYKVFIYNVHSNVTLKSWMADHIISASYEKKNVLEDDRMTLSAYSKVSALLK